MSVTVAVRCVCRRRHVRGIDGAGRGLCRLVAVVVAVAACHAVSANASDFKSLLADAGSLMFGTPQAQSMQGQQGKPEEESRSPSDAAPSPPVADAVTVPTVVLVAQRPDESKLPVDRLADTPRVDPAKTGQDAETLLRKLLPPRSDTPSDWHAEGGHLYRPGEPCALAPCVPPPPCDPSQPPDPLDLVGVKGAPSCGPIYRGPCEPRSARNHHGIFAWYHHLCDRWFDHFYRSK